VGAIIPLNLRLLGVWRSVPQADLIRVLLPAAIVGLALAVSAGAMLFSVRAQEYAAIGLFQAKLVLITLGVVSRWPCIAATDSCWKARAACVSPVMLSSRSHAGSVRWSVDGSSPSSIEPTERGKDTA
jgi:uncharacterized SAM-binding protein YcdF (DUF218 family)